MVKIKDSRNGAGTVGCCSIDGIGFQKRVKAAKDVHAVYLPSPFGSALTPNIAPKALEASGVTGSISVSVTSMADDIVKVGRAKLIMAVLVLASDAGNWEAMV